MKVLFVCTANSCRSQMAEAWAKHLFPAGWSVASAGLVTYPITEKTRWVMTEVGLDMAGQDAKAFDQVDLDEFDLVVTLSREAGTLLPRLGDPGRLVKCPIDDPMAARGTSDEVREAFRQGRERVRALVEDVVAGRIAPKPRS